jgi:hypothetical protein
MNRFDAVSGLPTGGVLVGNATGFTIQVSTETTTIKSKMRALLPGENITEPGHIPYGQNLNETVNFGDLTVGFILNQINRDTLAAVFLGDVVADTSVSQTVTDEELVIPVDGRWASVMNPGAGISAVTVTDEDGQTVYILDTDYAVLADLGYIRALPNGAIAAGATVAVSYTAAAAQGGDARIIGATRPIIGCELTLYGRNVTTSRGQNCRVFHTNIRPSSAVDFLSDDLMTLEFEGNMLTPAGKPGPFEVW